MKIRRRILQPVFTAFMMVFMAFLWYLFAPEPFGGQASYVIVAGASMEPGMHTGDLAIVRKEPVYRVGDVVTYQHPLAGPIIHRIVDREGDRYVFKGDNNDWVDSYLPGKDEFIGKLWVHLPRAAEVLLKLRSPLLLTVFSLLIAAGVFTSFSGENAKQRPGSKTGWKIRKKQPPAPLKDGMEGILFVLAALAFASGLLALISFTRPLTVAQEQEIPYEMWGEFQYSAPSPPGIYDGEQIQSGDPIYLQLTDQFDVSFQFQFISEQLSQTGGMIRLEAEISDPGGWRRRFELHPAVSFSGEAPRLEGTINLAELGAMIETLEESTGFERPYYTLEVLGGVTIRVQQDGREYLDTFEPRLTFHMEAFQLILAAAEPNTPRLAQFSPRQTGYLHDTVQVQNRLSILGVNLPVRTGRWISGVGLGLALLGLFGMAVLYVHTARDGEEARIAVKYASMLVDIREGNFANGGHRVEVSQMDDLGRLAERAGGVILHEPGETSHHYFVQDGEVTYHFQTTLTGEGDGHASEQGNGAMEDAAGYEGGGDVALRDVAEEGTDDASEDRRRHKLPLRWFRKTRVIFHSIWRRWMTLGRKERDSEENV